MNKDIRLSVDFFDHPKTMKLLRSMGMGALICLQRLWCFAGKYRPDGTLSDMEVVDIELAARWTGEQGEFVSGMVKLKWIDCVDGVYTLHDWHDHNGFAVHAKEREDQARKAAEKRWKKRYGSSDADADSNAHSNADSNPVGNAPIPSPIPIPIPSPIPTPSPTECSSEQSENLTHSEKAILDCVGAKRKMLAEKYPGIDIDIESSEICAKYRDSAIGCDPWLIVSRWFKNIASGEQKRASPIRNKTDYEALIREHEAEEARNGLPVHG